MLTNEDIKALDWEKTGGLIPAVVQDACSGRVLMLGCMNPEALEQILDMFMHTKDNTEFVNMIRHTKMW